MKGKDSSFSFNHTLVWQFPYFGGDYQAILEKERQKRMIQKHQGFEGNLAFLPWEVGELGRILRGAGHSILLCGGTVRDLLLGCFPTDLDLATSANPKELRSLLPSTWWKEGTRGEEFGSFLLKIGNTTIELTTFRSERNYQDYRHPGSVQFHRDLQKDWPRRDYSVNALYQDLATGEVLDPCGGLEDLFARRLRVLGVPTVRFGQDPLRVLRGIRFAAAMGFVPLNNTWRGWCDAAPLTEELSGARVGGEIQKILQTKGRARGLRLLLQTGVLGVWIPELIDLEAVPQPRVFHPEGPVLLHTECVLANLQDPVTPALGWAALLHDTGKKESFSVGEDRIRFHGHDQISVQHAQRILARFSIHGQVLEDCCALIAEHIRIASFPDWRLRKKISFLRDPLFLEHIALHRADCLGSHGLLGIHQKLLEAWKVLPPLPKKPLLNGKDLINAGWAPGPIFRQILDEIEEMRADGKIRGRQDALLFVQEFRRARRDCR